MAIENANPTIINVDELPTRRGKPKTLPNEKEHGILSLLTPTPNPALQIYLDGEEPISGDEEELEEEPIDEMEIYGSPPEFPRHRPHLNRNQLRHDCDMIVITN